MLKYSIVQSSFKFICISLITAIMRLDANSLESWNAGPAKLAIQNFVKEVIEVGNPNYIPVEDRIATFDQDGTLWVEQPMYTEDCYILERIKTLSPAHPEWKSEEPFKIVMAADTNTIESLSFNDVIKMYMVANGGVDLDVYHHDVSDWLKRAVHPRFKKPYTELVYKPMLELMKLLREHQFDIYIVSGGGQEFIRVFSKAIYGVEPSHVIGSAMKVQYKYQEGNPVLVFVPEVAIVNDRAGKVEAMNLMIGKRPVIAFGNSNGDQQMLEWTKGSKPKTLQLLIQHDDDVREYSYGTDSKIGNFSEALKNQADKESWILISMKNDWKTIF